MSSSEEGEREKSGEEEWSEGGGPERALPKTGTCRGRGDSAWLSPSSPMQGAMEEGD
jgi:hypothetical protein